MIVTIFLASRHQSVLPSLRSILENILTIKETHGILQFGTDVADAAHMTPVDRRVTVRGGHVFDALLKLLQKGHGFGVAERVGLLGRCHRG